MGARRVYYIDWLRVLAVLLLFPFHAGRVFNFGEPFYAKSPITSVAITYLLWFIDTWHMPLLFLLAGASTYFALRRRSIGQFARERALRLLVPLAFGVLVLVPPQTWYGAQTNAGYTGSYLEYLSGPAWSLENLFGRGDYFGGLSPAHLWFILFLWLISMIALPLLAFGRTERGERALARMAEALAKPRWWPLVVFVILLAEGLPEIGGKNLFYYLVFFVVGYVLIRNDDFIRTAERVRFPALVSGAALTVATIALFRWADALPDPSLQRFGFMMLVFGGGWLMIVGLMGYGKRSLDRTSPALDYLGESSYPVYILHQTVIVVIGFYLVRFLPWPSVGWPVLMALSAAVTFALYAGVRRARALRFLFGMKPRGRTDLHAAPAPEAR